MTLSIKRWRRIIKPRHIYLLAILLAYPLLQLIITTRIALVGDAAQYMVLSNQILENGFFNYNHPTRTYGYPLFLALLQAAVIPIRLNIPESVALIQFFIHIGTCLLATSLLMRLSGLKVTARQRTLWFLFFFISPPLLALTREMLTETWTIFCVTAFFWCFTSVSRWRYTWMSLALAFSMVLRPYHLIWAIVVLVSGGVIYTLFRFFSRNRQQPPKTSKTKPLLWWVILLQWGIPLVLIVGVQLFFGSRGSGRLGFTGAGADDYIQLHIELATYVYKYETLVINNDQLYPILYYADGLRETTNHMKANQQTVNPLTMLLANPAGMIAQWIFKAVGLFQNYDPMTYRLTSDKYLSLTFFWGLIPLCLLINALLSAGLECYRIIRRKPILPPLTLLIWIMLYAAIVYIGIYAVVTAPETRFVAPVLPIVMLTGVVIYLHRPQRLVLAFSACLTAVLYGTAFFLMIPTLIVSA